MTDTPKPLTADEIAALKAATERDRTAGNSRKEWLWNGVARLIATIEQRDEQIEKFQAAIEDALNTLEAMDLHVNNPLYERLRATLEPPNETLAATEPFK